MRVFKQILRLTTFIMVTIVESLWGYILFGWSGLWLGVLSISDAMAQEISILGWSADENTLPCER